MDQGSGREGLATIGSVGARRTRRIILGNGTWLAASGHRWKIVLAMAASLVVPVFELNVTGADYWWLPPGSALLGLTWLAFLCATVRCPRCNDRLLWWALARRSGSDTRDGFLEMEECPFCAFPREVGRALPIARGGLSAAASADRTLAILPGFGSGILAALLVSVAALAAGALSDRFWSSYFPAYWTAATLLLTGLILALLFRTDSGKAIRWLHRGAFLSGYAFGLLLPVSILLLAAAP